MGDILGLLNFHFFFRGGGGGGLKFLIFFGENGRCWAQTYVWKQNESPPLGFRYHSLI